MPVTTTETIDRGDTRTLSVQILASDVLTDPGALVLVVRNPALVSTTYTYGVGSEIIRDSVGVFSREITFTTAGAWTYEWRSTSPTQVQGETIQVTPSPLDLVAGTDAPYFTIGEARQVKPLDNAAKYPDAAIAAMRSTVERALEQRCGVAFVPRTATEIIDTSGATDVLLKWPRPLTVTTATLNGSTITPGSLILYPSGLVYYSSGWTSGRGALAITYTHGHATVPGEVKQAALILTKTWLVSGPVDDRATSMSTEDGTFALATPGLRGSSFGVPVVDAVVQAYSLNVAVA